MSAPPPPSDYTWYEAPFISLGLLGTEGSQYLRLGVGTVAAALLFYTLKPSFAFGANGKPKPWGVTTEASDKIETTMLPWWLASIGVGLLFALLI